MFTRLYDPCFDDHLDVRDLATADETADLLSTDAAAPSAPSAPLVPASITVNDTINSCTDKDC